jgi:tetratricopeptide (TPR) repeat protein
LQAAIAQKSQEGLNIKFYGMKFDDYLPHYYLGKAYFLQKNYKSALKEFDISSSQGEIQRNRNLFQNLSELKTLASAQMALNQPGPVIPEKKPESVQPEVKPVIPEKQPPPIQPEPKPVIPEKKPEDAIRDQPKVDPLVKPEPEKIIPVPPAPTQQELNLQRTKTMTREGARRYFQGDYDSAISSLSSALKLSPEDATAQFLLGCSFAAKYLLSGSSDQNSFQKASVAFQKIRRMSPNHPLTNSPLISPAVREIYLKIVNSG